jgi:hypothetical protein
MGSICLLRLTCLARADEGRIAKLHAERKCRCIVDLMRGGYERWKALRLQRVSGGTTHVIPAGCTSIDLTTRLAIALSHLR